MNHHIFAGLLIVAGAIVFAAAIMANGGWSYLLAAALIGWGVGERAFPALKTHFEKDE